VLTPSLGSGKLYVNGNDDARLRAQRGDQSCRVDWYVEDGETVPEGADLVEIEAEKARQVLAAPVAGVVRELQGDQGDVVEVRGLLCVIETPG
jgi:biotin carboxyl carrier protein